MSKARELAELSRTVSDSADAVAITIDASENVTFANDITVTGNVTADTLTLDDSNRNGFINVPASLFINIDSDNGATGESFVLAKDRTSASGGTELFKVQENGNVVISGGNLEFSGGTNDAQYIKFGDTGDDDIGSILYFHGNNNMVFTTNASEAMRISGGSLLVGKTASSVSTDGVELTSTGFTRATVNGDTVLQLNRRTSDGTIINFRKDGTTVGSIGTNSGYMVTGSPVGTAAHLLIGNGLIHPATSTGAGNDAAIDLGGSSSRFRDAHISRYVIAHQGAFLGGNSSSNYLNSYEEGSWSPLIQRVDGNVAASFTVSSGSARYTKIGNTVHLIAFIHSISVGSSNGSSYWVIYGIPFNGQVIDYSGSALTYNSTAADNAYVGDASGNAILVSGVATYAGSLSGSFMLNITYKIT